MLFVRCRGGISHNPAEFASVSDMGLAIAALIRFIERFKTMSDFIERNFAREVELLKALVRVPSDNPPGDCARARARRRRACCEGLGFKVERHPVPAELVKQHGMVSVTNLVIRERFGQRQGPGDRAQRAWRRGAAGAGLDARSLRRGGDRAARSTAAAPRCRNRISRAMPSRCWR